MGSAASQVEQRQEREKAIREEVGGGDPGGVGAQTFRLYASNPLPPTIRRRWRATDLKEHSGA